MSTITPDEAGRIAFDSYYHDTAPGHITPWDEQSDYVKGVWISRGLAAATRLGVTVEDPIETLARVLWSARAAAHSGGILLSWDGIGPTMQSEWHQVARAAEEHINGRN